MIADTIEKKQKNAKKKQESERKRTRGPSRLPYVDYHINATTITDTSLPVDYSFKKYATLKETGVELASTGKFGAILRSPKNLYLTRAVMLNNNLMQNCKHIDDMVNSVLEYPERLAFLDLSCNELAEIDNDLFKFANLKILYLHGNNFAHPKEIIKLRELKKLHSLTIYGNPICQDKQLGDIRKLIGNVLPKLFKLDYNRITKLEREEPLCPRALKIVNALLGIVDDFKKGKKDKKANKGDTHVGATCITICCSPILTQHMRIME